MAAGSSCDETNHDIDSGHVCVLCPVVGPTPPPGATYRCVDEYYSSSKHRQGTCSSHDGIAQTLDRGRSSGALHTGPFAVGEATRRWVRIRAGCGAGAAMAMTGYT
ncbi:DUF3761 domain-containing protein [Pseudonocardia bannensis]|uniref:DUF3761 domain-containing protein n=1 Tax=Pseudonocardia bannensis TaxID=630973 RepID=A0A848DLU8_9PSEU|nr:DUF3761 domain-containing protein [Pseudonocardia bannensis]